MPRDKIIGTVENSAPARHPLKLMTVGCSFIKQLTIATTVNIKSGLWLFNGGHINKDEALKEAVKREIDEELGRKIDIKIPKNPSLLTITNIDNLPKQLCKRHYEIWFFMRVKKNKFFPDEKRLEKEFYETRWLTGEEAKKLVIDPETLHGLKVIGSTF